MNEATKYLRDNAAMNIEFGERLLAADCGWIRPENLAAIRDSFESSRQTVAKIDAGEMIAWRSGEGPI